MTIRALMLALVLLAAAGCCGKPWNKFRDMPRPPDQSDRTGSVAGYDVYVWECLDGKRTVIYQWSAEMSCRRAEMQQVDCSEVTPFEKEIENEAKEPVPSMMVWPEQ